jgi:hypothetical protein
MFRKQARPSDNFDYVLRQARRRYRGTYQDNILLVDTKELNSHEFYLRRIYIESIKRDLDHGVPRLEFEPWRKLNGDFVYDLTRRAPGAESKDLSYYERGLFCKKKRFLPSDESYKP